MYFINIYIDFEVSKKISAAKNVVYLEVLGIGNIRINSFVNNIKIPYEIQNVYYVSDVKMNLLSISKVESNDLNIVFSNNTMNNQLLMLGKKVVTIKFNCGIVV